MNEQAAKPVESEEEAIAGDGALVSIEDNSIWASHITDKVLANQVREMKEKTLVVLATDNVIGLWEKMDNYKTDGTPVSGLKPFGKLTNMFWLGLLEARKGEEISFEILYESKDFELKEAALRAHAEMENIKRRSQKEVLDARKFAIDGFAGELLAVKDSLDQAAAVELGDEAVAKMKEGLELTLKQLDGAFARFAVEEVAADTGDAFDPEMHQAISTAPDEKIPAGHIVAVVQKGFRLKERLLRPALVVVADAPN